MSSETLVGRLEKALVGVNGSPIFKPKGQEPLRVLVLPPHPDDDVIQAGATIFRLVQQGCEVHVAALTSGTSAVWDSCVEAIVNNQRPRNLMQILGLESEAKVLVATVDLLQEIDAKRRGSQQEDSENTLKIKRWIRATEMTEALQYLGVSKRNIRFLNLPFYESGTRVVSDLDISIVKELFLELRPQIIFAAADLCDPHGTHRLCLEAVVAAWKDLTREDWAQDTEVLLSRGAWDRWSENQIDLAIPYDTETQSRKRFAIRQHRSQVPKAMFPGSDSRPFDVRALESDQDMALSFRKHGLLDERFVGVEAFHRWDERFQLRTYNLTQQAQG